MKRKWSELNVEKFFQDLDLNNLRVDSEELAEYMDKFNEQITFNLDNQIPLKEKKVSKVNSQTWFDNTLRDQKRNIRGRDRICHKYRQDHQWIAFKHERSQYHKMLRQKRKCFMRMCFKN